ncbi:hypothetical protein HPULCUR_001987 [Helicostylum pulchrum]|uniref:Dbl homology domain-containing protein n=1 Tax=Helicostylum pulchrum TaxID=562976 RepID=A0ABP9XP80_9FUNG
MSSVATDESNFGGLWRQPSSALSETSSNLTTSSGGDSSISIDLLQFDRENVHYSNSDQLSFITHRSEHYYQLMDDLAIIDEIYQTFDEDVESEPYERQVADAARNVAQKKNVADQMCQSEKKHITDLRNFNLYYLAPIQEWINDPVNTEIFVKYRGLCSKTALDNLFAHSQEMKLSHDEFCKGLKERLEMWGPTQFISDIFATFYERMSIYEAFLNEYPSTIVTLDSLYNKSPSFSKLIDSCVSPTTNPPVKDLVFYLKNPVIRLSSYSLVVSQMAIATEPSHPDYHALHRIKDKYLKREKKWRTIIKDRLAHVRVLEASRSIQGNPASVTTARRLYITGLLTQVNPSDPQSTSDTRTYLLFNDIFMFCQKHKPNTGKKLSYTKLQYKGMINLKHAEITPLSAKLIAKISEVKKPSALASFMRKSGTQNSTPGAEATLVYGFEIKTNEASGDMLAVGLDSQYPVPGHAAGNGVKRLIVMRTQTETEQNAWIALLKKTAHLMSRKR